MGFQWGKLFPAAGVAAGLVVGTCPSLSDVIVLKNGGRIQAATVREHGSRVSYETEGGEFTLPRSVVAGIERDAVAAASRAPAVRVTEVPLPPLPVAPAASLGLAGKPERARLLPNGEVDRRYLDTLAARLTSPEGGPEAGDEAGRRGIAAAFLAAIDYEMRRDRAGAAFALTQQAVSVLPLDPHLILAYGVLLLHKQQVQAARQWLTRARLAAPDSPQAWKFLGFAEYFSDRTDEAIRSWRKSLALAPDPQVAEMLARAQRETAAEARHDQTFSSHFILRFEGRQVAPEFRAEILALLERFYQELDRQLDASLREPIPVILYMDQMFRDVTRAPSWAGAINDGRLRVPVEGLSTVTPELARVLKHELAHSFVWAKTRGRCPTWLNEGLAQALEGSSARSDSRLAEFWFAGRRLPWAALQGSFMELDPRLVPFAYAQSLVAVEFLIGRYGMPEITRFLARLAEGQQAQAAMQTVYRMDYAALEQGISELLRGARR